MLQEPIYVPNGEFWEKLEELGDETYEQGVALDQSLVYCLEKSADDIRWLRDKRDGLLSWISPRREIVFAREIRDGAVYYKALLIKNSNSDLGFKHSVYECEKEFLFLARD